MYKSRFLPVGIRDSVQPSVKAGESNMKFRKRSVLWFCTSFIAQTIAYIHCFPHWTTSIPFPGLLQIDSADSWLCQDFFQILIFLCTDSPCSFSKMGLCRLLSAPAGSSSGQSPQHNWVLWHKVEGGMRMRDFDKIALESLRCFSP